MDFIKKNLILIIAFSLPIILIAGIALNVHLSALKPTTDYQFVYATCYVGLGYNTSYYCDTNLKKLYSIVDSKIVANTIESLDESNELKEKIPESERDFTTRLFLHNATTNQSREITLTEAKELTIDNRLTSPDGYTISDNYHLSTGGEFFIFGGGNYSNGYYLRKGDNKKRLKLIYDREYYGSGDFYFLGWVLPEKN